MAEIQLGDEDRADIDRLVAEIMSGMDCVHPSAFERHVREVLTRASLAADAKYAQRLADEEYHDIEAYHGHLVGRHHIAGCSIERCGRYPGQRRDRP